MAKQKKKQVGNGQKAVSNASPLKAYSVHLFIFGFALLLYFNTLGHGFVMDDGAVITNHETVKKGFSGIKELFGQSSVFGSTKENFGTYRPLTMSLFAIEWNFFKDNPASYHFIHVLLYSLLCVVIFILLKRLLKDFHPLIPLIASLLFAAHPVHTEVAANLKSADEILSLLFCSLSLLYALYYSESISKKHVALSFVFFLCALFSKESAATFIFIIPIALFLFTEKSRKTILTITGLNVGAILIYFLSRNSALDSSPEGIAIINNTLAGASSFSERYGTIFVVLLNYLKLLVFPHPLSWDYGYNHIELVGFGNPIALLSILAHLFLGIFAALTIFRRATFKLSNLPTFKLISFCILFYLIGLSVSSNLFVLIGSTMGERFLFTPSLGFCIVLAFGMIKLLKIETSTFQPSTFNPKLIPLAIILVLFSYKTYSRNKDWETNLTLFAKGAETCPNSYRTNITYAWESVLAGEKEQDKEKKKLHFQNAVTYYKKGLAIYNKVEADWYNYGVSNSNLGNLEEAVNCYQRALELNPRHRNSLYNLATVYMSRNDLKNSLPFFLRAYEIEPNFMDVSFKVGLIYHMTGSAPEAIPYYERFYNNNPSNKDVISNLSMAYMSAGNPEKALFYKNQLQK
jgi:protein O-mannosyl-transferase